MKLTNTKQLISFCAAFSLIGAVANAKKPEEQAGYDKSKDLGVKAPDGADTPFDGTMKSVKKNWEMWPKGDMDITWKIVKSPTDESKVLMTYGWKIGPHGIGAVCMEHVPKGNAWRPNGEWHSYHFLFKAGEWEGEKMKEPARLTLWWNGIKVHDNVPVKHANGGVKNGPSDESLKLQEHGQDVRFRNIWIKPIK
jgi:hypothetical protein